MIAGTRVGKWASGLRFRPWVPVTKVRILPSLYAMGDASDYYTYRGRVTNVVDGDTLDVFIDQGFEDYKLIRVRVKDVDTDEIFGVAKDTDEYQRGMEQKQFVEDFTEVDEHGFEDFPLSVRTFGKGKYGRWVGRIWKDGEDLANALIEEWPDVADE